MVSSSTATAATTAATTDNNNKNNNSSSKYRTYTRKQRFFSKNNKDKDRRWYEKIMSMEECITDLSSCRIGRHQKKTSILRRPDYDKEDIKLPTRPSRRCNKKVVPSSSTITNNNNANTMAETRNCNIHSTSKNSPTYRSKTNTSATDSILQLNNNSSPYKWQSYIAEETREGRVNTRSSSSSTISNSFNEPSAYNVLYSTRSPATAAQRQSPTPQEQQQQQQKHQQHQQQQQPQRRYERQQDTLPRTSAQSPEIHDLNQRTQNNDNNSNRNINAALSIDTLLHSSNSNGLLSKDAFIVSNINNNESNYNGCNYYYDYKYSPRGTPNIASTSSTGPGPHQLSSAQARQQERDEILAIIIQEDEFETLRESTSSRNDVQILDTQSWTYNAPETLELDNPAAILDKYCHSVSSTAQHHRYEDCSICLNSLQNQSLSSAASASDNSATTATEVVRLNACNHMFHLSCLKTSLTCMEQHNRNRTKCPLCRTSIIPIQGTSPSGTMSVSISTASLAGYKEYLTIVIEYRIQNGNQKNYHPNPGSSYLGATQTAYLPASPSGCRLLKRFIHAFCHGLTFRLGRPPSSSSSLSSMSSVCDSYHNVMWASIPHKTTMNHWKQSDHPNNAYFATCHRRLDSLGVPQDPSITSGSSLIR